MNKEEIILHYESQVERSKLGQENPLNIYGEINDLEKAINELRKEMYNDVLDEIDKYDRKEDVIFGDYEYKSRARTSYDYKSDAEYSMINQQLKNRKSLVKQASEAGHQITNPETGETVEPVKTKISRYPVVKYIGDKR